MKIVETEAIVLKSYSLAEADKIVLCLTRQEGFVKLSVRGAKRLKSRFSGSLEPFTIADIIYSQKEETELGRLTQAEVSESYFHLATRLNVLNSLSYLAEILAVTTPPHEPNEKLYRMVRACLAAVGTVKDDLNAVRLVVSYFETWLLRLGGFLPDFRSCVNCRRDIADKPVFYRAVEARLICVDCAGNDRRGVTLSPRLHKVLRTALSVPPLKFVAAAQLLEIGSEDLESVTHRLLIKLLEYEPRYWTADYELESDSNIIGKAA